MAQHTTESGIKPPSANLADGVPGRRRLSRDKEMTLLAAGPERPSSVISGISYSEGQQRAGILGAVLRRSGKGTEMNGEISEYKWLPIEPLSDQDREIDLA